MNEVIWEGTLDNRWYCVVERTGNYEGLLSITDTENKSVVHEEAVGLSYDAVFGPDAYDINVWEEKAMDVVDNQL